MANSIENIKTTLRWHSTMILALYGLLGVMLVNLVGKLNFSVITGNAVAYTGGANMDLTILQPALVVLAAFARSVFGWAEASFRDGIIQDYEWRKLGETMIRVLLFGLVAAYFPGLDLSWLQVSACALAGDLLLSTLKKKKEPISS